MEDGKCQSLISIVANKLPLLWAEQDLEDVLGISKDLVIGLLFFHFATQ